MRDTYSKGHIAYVHSYGWTNQEPPFTEATILLKGSGDHIGEYIAECPNGRCGYFGQLPQAVAFQDEGGINNQTKK